MESQNLKHWWMVTRTSEAVLSYPSQMAAHSVSVQDSYHVRNVTNSVNTSVTNSAHEREADSDGTYSFQCGAEEIIQNVIKDKLSLVRKFKYSKTKSLFSSTPLGIPNLAHCRALLYCRCVRTWGGVLAW